MGVAAFNEVKAETPQTQNQDLVRYVQCVSSSVAAESGQRINWEVGVFESPEVNAFALPGGKIGVFTGILEVAELPDQLAAVLAHEVAHVIAKHSEARVSAAMATEAGLGLTSAALGSGSAGTQQLLALLGVGMQVGVLLPYSREQETEADTIGLDLMARAGFEPRGALDLWRNMSQVGGGQPPVFLSTHPSHEGRIRALSEKMPSALERFQAARQAGKAPRCTVPAPAQAF